MVIFHFQSSFFLGIAETENQERMLVLRKNVKYRKMKMSGIRNEEKVFPLISPLLLSGIFPRDTFNMNVIQRKERVINILLSKHKNSLINTYYYLI